MVFDSTIQPRLAPAQRCNTPLQALTLLNDRGYYQFAQGLAQRILREPATSEPERLALAFRLCLARSPLPEEASRINTLLSQQMENSGVVRQMP